MGTSLGDAILNACWEQGWAVDHYVTLHGDVKMTRILRPLWLASEQRWEWQLVLDRPRSLFLDVQRAAELFVVLDQLRAVGLRWPWPPQTSTGTWYWPVVE